VLWRPGSLARPSRQGGGRWNRAGEQYAQYLSLSKEGAWGELIRQAEIEDELEAAHHRRRLWELRFVHGGIADLRTWEQITAAGLDPPELVGPAPESYPRCHSVRDDLEKAGFRGALVPNAAVAGATNLVLFGPRTDVPLDGSEQFGSASVDEDEELIEVQLLPDGPAPPIELIPRVRGKGRSGNDYGWELVATGAPTYAGESEGK
jgi:RES domain-containing protein